MKYFYDTEFIEDGKTIDLVSIGIVAEDGRTYYAINKECNFEKADEWVRKNVIDKLEGQLSGFWKTKKEIKEDIIAFIGDDKPELWAYYADYDHVVFCQLFGRMIDLPNGYPFYTLDIKQLCNSIGNPSLPVQDEGEHNALADAKWNMEAYYYLVDLNK